MRSAPLLLLAACSASARPPVASAVEPEPAPAPVAAPAPQVIESQTTIEHADDAARLRPVRTYALPATTTSALARERVRGQVLVAGPLFPTEAAAKGLVSTIDDAATPVAMKVVADKGKVVQVTTSTSVDCVDGFPSSYELTVFVPRSSLVPRTTAEITKTFEDGTAYAIDRGAPVRVTAAGAAWFDAMLDQTSATPPERLAYSLAKPYAPAAVPVAPGERLVCDGAPMTKAEWTARKQRQADARAAKTSAAARKAAEVRAQSRTKTDAIDGLVDLALDDGTATAKALTGGGADLPYCMVATPSPKPVTGKLGGAAYVWSDARTQSKVYRAEQGYLADVGATCARVRVAVEPTIVGRPATADTSGLRAARQKVWVPKPGTVYWPDGKKAGKYTGTSDRYTRVTERDGMVCVDVRGVASEVCHKAADVTVEK